jgi:putative tricarboxylic transport membrane protein
VDFFTHLAIGLETAATPVNLAFCFIGVLLGTVIGLLPGLGSTTGVALLLPLTLTLEPVTALIMLAGIYYGVQYGATIASVLVATPGDAASMVTMFDGYPMARAGRAGPALAIAAIASFLSGTASVVLLMGFAPVFAGVALNFGPPEIFALIVLGLVSTLGFTGSSRAKGLAMMALGLGIATVGVDPQSGVARFTFGNIELFGGIGFVPAAIGLFAIAEVVSQARSGGPEPIRTRFREMLLTREDWRRSRMAIVRSGLLGFFMGLLPGAGATLASFLGYDMERRWSKHSDEFGKGAIEGVAAPEAANNAATNGAFVPTLTLGIPGSGTTAVLLGAFVLFGIQPGPLLLEQQPDLVWGLIVSFYIGNFFLLALNLPLAPAFASILRLRYNLLYPLILVLAFSGAYALENRMWSVWLVLAFGVIGYFMKRHNYAAAPLLLGLILGPLLETNLVRTSSMGGGDLSIFLDRPIALILFAFAALIILWPFIVKGIRSLSRRTRQ